MKRVLVLEILVLGFCFLFTNFAIAKISIINKPFTTDQQDEIKKIVHDYLIQHPEVLIESSKALRTKMMVEMEKEMVQAARENADELFRSSDSPVIGNPNGKVTIVEFFDYNCSHCRKIMPVLHELVKKNKDLRVVFKDFAMFGESSVLAAKAAIAAKEQGKFKALHKEMMTTQKRELNREFIEDLAREARLNMKEFNQALESEKVENIVKESTKLAVEKLKLRGSPMFFIAKTDIQKDSTSTIACVQGWAAEETFQKMIDKVKEGD